MSVEEMENMRKRLIFRSGHRGTKEMDLLLGSFAEQYVPGFTERELAEYETLLSHNDPDLYNWITEQEQAPDDVRAFSMFSKIVGHRFSVKL